MMRSRKRASTPSGVHQYLAIVPDVHLAEAAQDQLAYCLRIVGRGEHLIPGELMACLALIAQAMGQG